MKIEECETGAMMCQVGGMPKTLVPARRITIKGHMVVLGDEESNILHMATGERITLHEKGSAIIIERKIMLPRGEGRTTRAP